MTLGIDVSSFQDPAALPWAAWRSTIGVVVIQTFHGDHPEPRAAAHLEHALAAGYLIIGAYHFLYPGNTAWQVTQFLMTVEPGYSFCALDIEAPGITPQDVLGWVTLYEASCKLPLILYGNNLLAACVAKYPQLAKYPVWWANYPAGLARISEPPAGTHPSAPAGLNVVGWQFTGKGLLLPYPDDIDLTDWYTVPGQPDAAAHVMADVAASLRADAARLDGLE